MVLNRKNVIIWGAGENYSRYINQIQFEKVKGNMDIVAIVSKDKYASYIDGIPVIRKDAILTYSFDYLIICSSNAKQGSIEKEAMELGILKSKILNGHIFEIPCFDLLRYCSFVENPLTIISDNCWGGVMASRLYLEFNSPFINMSILKEDYFKLLENLNYYLDEELVMEREGDLYSCVCPLGSLGQGQDKVILRLVHCATFVEAKSDWDRRKKRINRDNIFVKMAIPDNNKDSLERFDQLSYKNKVCFCPKKMSYKSTVYLPRYIWQNKYTDMGKGEIGYGTFVSNFDLLSRCIDILKMLCGESGFIREE